MALSHGGVMNNGLGKLRLPPDALLTIGLKSQILYQAVMLWVDESVN